MRWVVLLLLASCGSGDPAGQDGRRLFRRYWVYEDGTHQQDPSSFFDAVLDLECRPLQWSDGQTYCTPDVPVVAYLDGACTQPVGRIVDGERPHAFLRQFTMAAERRPSRMYRPTKERAPVDEFWIFDGAACVGPFDSGNASYVDLEEFPAVRLSETAPIGDGRVRVTTRTTEDGLSMPARLIDTLADSACVPDPTTFGCVPTTVAEVQVFRDTTCTQPLVTIHDGGPSPIVARTGCSDYFHRGREVLNFPSYVASEAGCVEVDLDPIVLAYELGERFPIAQLERRLVGDSRLRPIEVASGDLVVPTTLIYDSMLDTTCEPMSLDGTTRCMPPLHDAQMRYFYVTETCDEAVPFVLVKPGCDPARFTVAQRGFPFPGITIRELSEPYRAPVYTRPDGIACVPTDPGADIYASHTVIPIESFVRARRE